MTGRGYVRRPVENRVSGIKPHVERRIRRGGELVDFSVVMPLYNKGPHVEAAVRSALGQSLAAAEIIVVDDGSTDGGPDVVEAIGDPRLRLFSRSPPGPGGYAARNLGVEAARGEWIAFLDADDLWKPRHLELLSAAIASAGDAGCAFAGLDIVTGARRIRYPQSQRHLKAGCAMDLATVLRAWLDTGRCPLWTGAVAIRRDVLLAAGLFPAGRARRGGDKDLWLRCIARAPSVHSSEPTAEFHHDTVNRVSRNTRHTELPILVGTIEAMLATVGPGEARLLKRLANQEIVQYARHAAGARTPASAHFLRELYLPAGWLAVPKVGFYLLASQLLKTFART